MYSASEVLCDGIGGPFFICVFLHGVAPDVCTRGPLGSADRSIRTTAAEAQCGIISFHEYLRLLYLHIYILGKKTPSQPLDTGQQHRSHNAQRTISFFFFILYFYTFIFFASPSQLVEQ